MISSTINPQFIQVDKTELIGQNSAWTETPFYVFNTHFKERWQEEKIRGQRDQKKEKKKRQEDEWQANNLEIWAERESWIIGMSESTANLWLDRAPVC